MSRGRRYNNKPKLNIKKVIAVAVALILIVMFIIALKTILSSDSSASKLVSTNYFLINKDNRWGVIDNNAKTIIEPTYEEAIIIPNSKKPVFICTYNTNYQNGTYETRVLNEKGKEIFTKYDKVIALENYDENNNLWYEDNALLVEENDKYGLINFEGKEILDINYDKIYTLKGIKSSLITEKDQKLGLVNNLGQEIIKNEYQEIKPLGKDSKNYIIKQNDKYGVNEILECKYDEILQLNNNKIYCVKEENKYKVINAEGTEVFTEKFEKIESIKDNIIVYKNSKGYCAYNIETKEKLNKNYKDLKYTANQIFIAKTNDKYGLINMKNEIKAEFNYSNINYFDGISVYELEQKDNSMNIVLNTNLEEIAQGVINETNAKKYYVKVWTEEGYKYYDTNGTQKNVSEILTQNNLFLSKQNGKYGFVDKDGNVVVDYIYDDAKEQNEFGYIAVNKDGLWGSLDKNGKVISETKHDLEDNLVIDFIGEYYLGIDLNTNYYTK